MDTPEEERRRSRTVGRATRPVQRRPTSPAPSGVGEQGDDREERSLDLVQRMIISALIIVVFGLFAGMLAAYLAFFPEESSRGSTIGLWAMTGAFGLVTAAAVLLVNRRRPYAPWVLLGLLPMAISAFWVL